MWVRFEDEKWDISTLGVYGFSHNYLGLKASIILVGYGFNLFQTILM